MDLFHQKFYILYLEILKEKENKEACNICFGVVWSKHNFWQNDSLKISFQKMIANHSSLLSVFGLNATSTYNSYLPWMFGKFALIWGHFQNILTSRFEDAEVAEVKQPRNQKQRKF